MSEKQISQKKIQNQTIPVKDNMSECHNTVQGRRNNDDESQPKLQI